MNFKEAYELKIGSHVEKKGKFSYLSWSFAVKFLRENFPEATWEIRHFDDIPYKSTPAGCFVEVTVFIDSRGYSQVHPVLNHSNKVVKEPDAFMVNTSIQRCLTKAIALATGIGLGLYAGEDLPVEQPDPITQKQVAEIETLLEETKADRPKFLAWVGVSKVEEITTVNFNKAAAALKAKKAKK